MRLEVDVTPLIDVKDTFSSYLIAEPELAFDGVTGSVDISIRRGESDRLQQNSGLAGIEEAGNTVVGCLSRPGVLKVDGATSRDRIE